MNDTPEITISLVDLVNREVNRRVKMEIDAYKKLNDAKFYVDASNVFKELRGEMTLSAISEKTGVSISQWSDVEHRRSNPSIEQLEKIANALGKIFFIAMYDIKEGD